MKRFLFLFSVLFLSITISAQDAAKLSTEQPVDTFLFTTIKQLPVTPVKNQSSSGTCWSFSGIGLIEAELLRLGKGEFDLSEMFVVHKNYGDKAKKYARMHGATNFAGGGSFADVLDCIKDYGIVPDEVQAGLNYGDTIHRHSELDAILKAYIDAVIKSKKLSTAWHNGLSGILDAYLGACPETFTYKGKQYTPKSFAQFLGINPDDYISLTSFTHHPFYQSFPIEVPDNWRWSYSYNIPLDEMMQIVDEAINKAYTVAWAADVSETGFSRKGIAVVPDVNATEGPGSDQERWLGLSQSQRDKKILSLTSPVPEKKISQELRQTGFDNYETQDDHGMLIYGTAQDQYGSKYYLVKNSWGNTGSYQGIWYASVPFVKYKTISIVVHKDVLSKELKNKLGIK
ncbi:MAG: aminopeptidase [Dysgonamonadaceae bacterium]|jgi:aminopeptidase C|nr:aminopeptidase [Dysgonamonadaceae bacterium]